jgi:hypothetical protein
MTDPIEARRWSFARSVNGTVRRSICHTVVLPEPAPKTRTLELSAPASWRHRMRVSLVHPHLVLVRGLLFACAVTAWLALAAVSSHPARAQTAADISAAAGKVCAVMSGQTKPDSRTLQYLLLLDEDMADPNPVALALYRDVLHECPKAYLGYEQRLRTRNPFTSGTLLKQTPTKLYNSGTSLTKPASAPDFPIRCRGTRGMASSEGSLLVVTFTRTEYSAAQGLQPGQCAWLDRAVRPNEPTRIDVPLASASQSQNGVAQINAGGMWTFWVTNVNTSLRATAVAKGTPAQKP